MQERFILWTEPNRKESKKMDLKFYIMTKLMS